MNTNKFISYLLCNKGIIVNLYKLHFLSSYFSFQPNKRVFHPPTFLSLQPNTHEGKLNIFHSPTFSSSHNFLSSNFFTPPTKQTLRKRWVDIRGVRVRCSAVLGHFQHRILWCGLSKTITAPHFIFAVTCAMRFKFSQNHNRTAFHFCSHICGAVYKMRFE